MKSSSLAVKQSQPMQTATKKLLASLMVTSPYAEYTTSKVLRGRDITTIEEMTAAEIELVLACATALKVNPKDPQQKQIATGMTLAMLFEKPSLRTRVTFEVGMNQLGGSALFLKESLANGKPSAMWRGI